jgi:lipopolysaccharide export system permease protein
MKILDWYIIKKYLGTFFYTTVIFTVVSIVINISERIGWFISNKLTAKQVFLDYYLHFIPWINGLLWPLFALLAVIFFTSRLTRNSEIISMLGAGMNFTRILRPMLIAAFFVAFLLWIGNNYIIPISTKKKVEFESEYIRRSNRKILTSNLHWFINDFEKVYCRYYDNRDSSITTFRLDTYNEDGSLASVFKVKELKFLEEPSKWRAEDYEIRTFISDDQYTVYHSRGVLDTNLLILPSDFVRQSKQMEMMNSSDLKELIATEKSRGLDNTKPYEIELYRRTSDPFTVIILTLIGATLASKKIRGGLGFHLAAGIAIGSIFVVLSKFTITYATNLSLPPILGCWLPNIFFGAISLYLLKLAQR